MNRRIIAMVCAVFMAMNFLASPVAAATNMFENETDSDGYEPNVAAESWNTALAAPVITLGASSLILESGDRDSVPMMVSDITQSVTEV